MSEDGKKDALKDNSYQFALKSFFYAENCRLKKRNISFQSNLPNPEHQ